MRRSILLLLVTAISLGAQTAVESNDLNTVLMHSTFLITGPKAGAPEQTAFGTVFIVGVPLKAEPKRAAYTLVTAAHVLNDIAGDLAKLQMRSRGGDGAYSTFWLDLNIRKNGKQLYTTHDTVDLAAMYIGIPKNVPLTLVPIDFLADDKRIEELEIHPGDEAYCLGFPLAASTPGGFPILRTGRIASYPITPAAKVKSVVFDLFLYPGNSGGPVYYVYDNRIIKGAIHIGRWSGILGLVIQQASSNLPGFTDKPLNLGIIVPAYFIRETIAKLPEPK
jgi:S1-C subfamily serine protease